MIPIMKTVVSLRSPRISYQDKCLAKISQNQNLKNKISHFVRSTIIPLKEIEDSYTLRSQIEGYPRLLIFRKFSTLPAVISASPFINFQENFQPPCFHLSTQMKFFHPTRCYQSLPLY